MAKWTLLEPYCTNCKRTLKFTKKSNCDRCDRRVIPENSTLAFVLLGLNTRIKLEYEDLINVVDYLLRKNVNFKCKLEGDNAKFGGTLGERLSKARSFSEICVKSFLQENTLEKTFKRLPRFPMSILCGKTSSC